MVKRLPGASVYQLSFLPSLERHNHRIIFKVVNLLQRNSAITLSHQNKFNLTRFKSSPKYMDLNVTISQIWFLSTLLINKWNIKILSQFKFQKRHMLLIIKLKQNPLFYICLFTNFNKYKLKSDWNWFIFRNKSAHTSVKKYNFL